MARRRNPESKYFDAGSGQLIHFDYVEMHTGSDGREAYLLPNGTWLSGRRREKHGNLLQRKSTKKPPRWVQRNPASCEDLPESPWTYFERPTGTVLVSVNKLKPIRARPNGIRNAKKYMRMACEGTHAKRAPIDVSAEGEILDGNSTYAVARDAGWKKIPALVHMSSGRDKKHGVVLLGFDGLGVERNPRKKRSRKTTNVDLSDYPRIRDMEGPFMFPNGRVVYYDPRAGQYYDRDTDMYLSQRESDKLHRLANPQKSIKRTDYPAIFGDTDHDRIPDVDDPHPFDPGDTKSIEEVRLADEVGALIDIRGQYADVTDSVMDTLRGFGIAGSKVQGRVKTPFSLINKLRRKRLGTLTDIAATRIIVPDYASVEAVAGAIEGQFEVLEKEDFYKDPQAGYRALHYIVRVGSVPVEIQVKTHRMMEISSASHTAYKRGLLNAEEMDRLTSLAARADKGDLRAAAEIDPLLRNKSALSRALTHEPNPRTRRLMRRVRNGGL
jgi:hypothetical protein